MPVQGQLMRGALFTNLPRGNHMDKPQLHHTHYYQAELSTQILTRRLENGSHFSFSPQKSWEVR